MTDTQGTPAVDDGTQGATTLFDQTPPTPSGVYDPTGNLTAIPGSSGSSAIATPDQEVQNQNRSNTLSEHLEFAVPGVIAAAVDTVGQSVGLLKPDDMQNYLAKASAAPGFADYYANNKSGLKLAGDLATFLIPGTVGAKAVQSGSWLFKAVQAERIPMLQKLFTSAADIGELTSTVYDYDLLKAGKGAVDFVSADPTRNALVAQVYKSGISDSVKRYIGSESAIYLTMNKSDNFYPEDMSLTDQILMHSVGLGISTGIETAFIRSSLKRGLWSDAIKTQVEKNLNPLDLPISVDTPGDRDFSATINSVTAAEHRATRLASNDPDVVRYSTKLENISNVELKNDLAKMSQDGLPGVIAPNQKNTAGIATLQAASQADPTIPKGIITFTNMPNKIDDLTALADKGKSLAIRFNAKADKLIADDVVGNADEINKLQADAERLKTPEAVVIEPSGEVHRPADIKSQFQYLPDPPEIERLTPTTLEDGKYTLDITNPSTNERSVLALSDKLVPNLPAGKQWTDLTRFEQSGMYALGQNFIKKYQPGKLDAFGNKIVLNDKSSPFMLDTVRQLVKEKPAALNDFQLPNGAANNFDKWAEQQSLIGKYKQFATMMDKFNEQGASTITLPTSLKLSLDDIRYGLNFPSTAYGQQHPAFNVFRSIYMQGDRDLTQALGNIDHFQGMMKTEMLRLDQGAGNISDPSVIDTLRAKPISTVGSNLAYPTNADGSFMKAQIAWIKPAKWDLTQTSMNLYGVSKKANFLSEFNKAPDMIRGFSDKILGTGAYDTVSKGVTTLAEGQQFGHGIVGYQNMATRGLDAFTGADMISNNVENNARQQVRQLFSQGDAAFLNLQKNDGDMFQFAQFTQARRFGFELLPDTADAGNGNIRFKLKADEDTGELSARNQTAWKRAFGDAAPPPDGLSGEHYLPDIISSKKLIEQGGQYAPLELGQGAFAGVTAIKNISDQLWNTGNFFRTLYGRSPLGYQEWHVPPQNLRNTFIKYIVQPTDAGAQPVKTLVSGKTASELEAKMAAPAIQDLLKRPGAFAVDQNDMRRYFDLHDDAFFNMVDYSDGLGQTGKNTGSAVSPLLEYGNTVLNDMIKGVENQVISYGRRTTASIFQDEINYARMADKASDVATTAPKGTTNNSIWQSYTNRLLGLTVPASENIINAEVPLIDSALGKISDTLRAMIPSKKVIEQGEVIGTQGQVKDYEKLRKILGGRLPFTDAADFAANTFRVKTPLELAKISGSLNAIAGTTVLRLLEVGNGVVSLVGNLVSMPLVMNNLKRMPYDTDASWAAKTGFMGTDLGNGFALPNPVRMMSKGISYLFTKEGQDMLTDAYKVYGNLKPQMAENFKVMHAPFQGPAQRYLGKVVDFLSTPSDKGEEWSRVWAYSAGYQIGKLNNLANKTDLHNMANLFADNVIANYRPVNKPQVFQGAIGSSLGLFQTYMWNYYGRMFQYIENKNYRALAINYAMQGSIFGMESVPGWQQFQDLHAHAYNGEHDLVDNLDKMYGSRMADMLLHGTISNIPRLFGKEGIALYSRGDVNLTKIPAFIDPSNAPIYSLSKNAIDLVGSLMDQFRTGGAPNAQQTLETLGSYSINRPIGRLFELAAGVAADKRGAIVNADTRSQMSVVARLMSLRPQVEEQNIESNARIANTEAWQQTIHDRADVSMRSIFRDSSITPEAINNKLSHITMDYIGHGGNPNNVGELIRNAAIAANVTKQDRKLMEVINNPSRLNDVLRLVNNINSFNTDGEK